MSVDKIFDLTAGVYFYFHFYNIYPMGRIHTLKSFSFFWRESLEE